MISMSFLINVITIFENGRSRRITIGRPFGSFFTIKIDECYFSSSSRSVEVDRVIKYIVWNKCLHFG